MYLFSSKKTVSKIKWLLSESYISKVVKRIESITCTKVLKHILALYIQINLVLVNLGNF